MKKLITVITLGVAVFNFTSCSKSSDAPLHDRFVGKWKLHTVTFDDNGNGVKDASDATENVDSLNQIMTLNTNGTGSTISTGGSSTPLTWSISSDSKYLILTDSGSTADYNYITSAPGSSFTLLDTIGGIKSWGVFNKQ